MKLFRRRAPSQAALRKKALALTPPGLSAHLLSRFQELVYHTGMSGNRDTHYQDREILGAVCCTPSEAMLMYHAARLCNPRHALEIGSYIGWSSAHIASGLSRCVLTCVDPFSETGQVSTSPDSASERAYARFLQNIVRAGLSDKVRLVRDHSPDAIPGLSTAHQWDFIFVDGWHLQGQPIRDVVGVLPYASTDAVLLLHDLWIADVRDAFLYLVAHGWSHHIFSTSNYLTILWREEAPSWINQLIEISRSDSFVLKSADYRKLFVGLVDESISAVRQAYTVNRDV